MDPRDLRGFQGERRSSNHASAGKEEFSQETVDAELAVAKESFDCASRATGLDGGLSLLQFALQLLGPHNNAVSPASDFRTGKDVKQPMAHYWAATTHKYIRHQDSNHSLRLRNRKAEACIPAHGKNKSSYIVGDQLTGLSSADAYRRQLLQGYTGEGPIEPSSSRFASEVSPQRSLSQRRRVCRSGAGTWRSTAGTGCARE